MSAIAGIYRFSQDPLDVSAGAPIMESLKRYPADRSSVWQQGHVWFGCHAQWITQQSAHELLPFYCAERRLAITADAIIDNRDELMDGLQVPSRARQAMTDGEILLLAYEKWGESMPERLVGDFAFMIWDGNKQMLFGARDFSGARTLYYHRNGEQLAFCTAIRPLLSLPYVHQELNEPWLAEFLAISGVFEPPDLSTTVYRHIEQLPPSHTLTVRSRQVSVSRYYSLTETSPLQLKTSEEYQEAFRDVFNRAVTSRLQRTSRMVGAHLSGGLDSGSVAGFAAKALERDHRKLHTFSYVPEDGFEDWTPKRRLADERPLIRQTVQHAVNIEDSYLSFNGRSPYTDIDHWLDIMETPYKFFENSFWLRGIYEQAHERGVGILLNGARGNYSISWGNALDYYAKLMKKMAWVRLRGEINQYSMNIGVGRKRIIAELCKQAFPLLKRRHAASSANEFPQLVNPAFARQAGVYDKLTDRQFTEIGSGEDLPSDPVEARKYHFDSYNVWSTTGTSVSKLSLQYPLWAHDPTNDLRVIRFCLSVPMEQYVQNGLDRALIRRSAQGYLPDNVRLNQRLKGIQAADILHRMTPHWSQMIQELDQLCRDPRMQQVLNIPVVRKALDEARNGMHPSQAYSPAIKVLMRSLIVYRFLERNF